MTHDEPLYPLRFRPILKRLIWGGRRLGTMLDKPIGPESDYAESWEVSDHRESVSIVDDGPLAGTSLRDLIASRGAELLGEAVGDRDQFPLLVKYLDANQHLSVQVHPDDALGRSLADDNGKTEMWVIIHADPGSKIFAGLRPGVSREAFAGAIATGDVEPLLHRFEPKPGDAILIPAGTVHAIGAGVVLAEIQQMSDATFRVHDWGRLGADGQPRAMHTREAQLVIDFDRGPVDPMISTASPIAGGCREALSASAYFSVARLRLTGASPIGLADRFTLVLCLEGNADLVYHGESYPILKGQTRLVPASSSVTMIRPRESVTLLTCVIP